MNAPIPDGYHSVTPSLTVRDAVAALEFYKAAFGATEILRLARPDGLILHAEIKIGNSILMLSEENPDYNAKGPKSLGGASGSFMIYVPDADVAFERAVGAGATVLMPLQMMFWGDRSGRVQDPFGHIWALASKVEDVSTAELEKRVAAFIKENSGS